MTISQITLKCVSSRDERYKEGERETESERETSVDRLSVCQCMSVNSIVL